jgi:hypothetical protein
MDIIISWKDTLAKEVVSASAVYQQGASIKLCMAGDKERHYPVDNIWYWQTPLPDKRSLAESPGNLYLTPKDNANRICLEGVETFCIEGETLLVVFAAGYARNYPFRHLKYWEIGGKKKAESDFAFEADQ